MRSILTIFAILLFAIAAVAQPPDSTEVNKLVLKLQDPPRQVPNGNAQLVGNPGPRALYYWVVTRNAAGNSGPAGPFVVQFGPNALSSTNSVTITWTPIRGATGYDVLRTSTPNPPSGACNCAVAAGVIVSSASDQSDTLQSYTVTTLDPKSADVILTNEGGALKIPNSVAGTQTVTGNQTVQGNQVVNGALTANSGSFSGAIQAGTTVLAGFEWLPFTVGYDVSKGFQIAGWNISSYAPSGKTYYVDPTTGNDTTGDGSEALPFASIYKAVGLSDSVVIMAKPGIYGDATGIGTTILTHSASLKRWGTSGTIQIVQFRKGLGWSATGTHSFVVNRSGVVAVLDGLHPDASGKFPSYTLKASAAEVDAAAGSWYLDGSNNLYVRPSDDRALTTAANSLTLWPLFSSAANKVLGDLTLYMEHVQFVGGSAAFQFGSTAVSQSPKLYCYDCQFRQAQTNNGLYVVGAAEVYVQNSLAADNKADGFNYHAGNGIAPKVVEINCVGRDNGWGGGDINNGSTSHEASTVFRVNGTYVNNDGPNVADVSTGTKSWCLGCVASKSMAAAGAQSSNYMTDDGAMWLDHSVSGYGSSYDLYVTNAGGSISTRQIVTSGINGGAGTIATY
jgi:hypothetical protein